MRVPSLRIRSASNGPTACPLPSFALTSSRYSRCSGGVSAATERPSISCSLKPKMRSAAAFQLVTMPSVVRLTIASNDEWTIASLARSADSRSFCSLMSSR